jgi:hypothetical protein
MNLFYYSIKINAQFLMLCHVMEAFLLSIFSPSLSMNEILAIKIPIQNEYENLLLKLQYI